MGKKIVKQIGRKSGGHNKGYWYRKGRGWYTTVGQKKIPLTDEGGNHLQDPDTSEIDLKNAYARYLLGKDKLAVQQATGDGVLVHTCVQSYINHSHTADKPNTFTKRGEFLFDFCYGLTARYWNYGGTKTPPTPALTDYIHDGFASRPVNSIIPMDIQRWLDVHPRWGDSTQRMAIQSVKRCFNYCVEMGLLSVNPIKGMRTPRGGRRITYFTETQEKKMYEYATKAFALAIKVCIRTGVRYGAEFAALTHKHVKESAEGMRWVFSKEENKTGKKTGKERVIFVPDEIAVIVREQLKKYPTGYVFRNRQGKGWKQTSIREAFSRLRKKLAKNGVTLDSDACFYSTRHTFAKRMIGGYWTGKPTTLEILAGLMGNTQQVCVDHYASWVEGYQDPLWDAINGKS